MRACCAPESASEYTATVSMPSSRQARTIRTAISPRLATRTRSNGRLLVDEDRAARSGSVSVRKDTGSERDVAMLLPRVRVVLVGEDLERPDEPRTSLARE